MLYIDFKKSKNSQKDITLTHLMYLPRQSR